MKNIYKNIPTVSQLNKVKGFDPSKFLHKKISPLTKKPILDLDLKYKKLWFRLAHRDGRIATTPLELTAQKAVFKCEIYYDKNDEVPVATFTTCCSSNGPAGAMYVQQAQYEATDQALNDAGFGGQFCDVNSGPDSEVYDKGICITDEKEIGCEESVPSAPDTDEDINSVPKEIVEVPASTAETKTTEESDLAEKKKVSMETPAMFNPDDTPVEQETSPENGEEVIAENAQLYTTDMPVSEISALMSLEDALNYIVDVGTCKGCTLGHVVRSRPASLKWYLKGYPGEDNILRAGAKLLLEALEKEKETGINVFEQMNPEMEQKKAS